MTRDSADFDDARVLVSQAAKGDSASLAALVDRYRERLERMIRLRLDRRLRRRVDASDIVQEALAEAARRLSDYARRPSMEFYLWLRLLTADKLLNAHRRHLGTQKRDAGQEISLCLWATRDSCSVSLAQQLFGHLTSPSGAAVRAELQLVVQQVLNAMAPMDREILVLRSFEQLSTAEAAKELGIKRSTAGKRYIAALKRLKQALFAIPGLDQQILSEGRR